LPQAELIAAQPQSPPRRQQPQQPQPQQQQKGPSTPMSASFAGDSVMSPTTPGTTSRLTKRASSQQVTEQALQPFQTDDTQPRTRIDLELQLAATQREYDDLQVGKRKKEINLNRRRRRTESCTTLSHNERSTHLFLPTYLLSFLVLKG
jgi:hypothetical protein